MKTTAEKQYEKLIIHYISHQEICPAHRSSFFFDFFRNSESYYEDLCGYLYELSTKEISGPLWLSRSGQIYAGAQPQNISDVMLSDCSDFPDYNGDIVEHLDYVFSKIYSIFNQKTPVSENSCGCIGLY